MVVKASYDFESKREYRRLWRNFISKQFSKEKQRRGLDIACFPAQEVLEITECYLPLGIQPHRIYAVEREAEVARQLRANLESHGLNAVRVYEGDAQDFFEDTSGRYPQKFDVINLDFQGQLKEEERTILHTIFERRRNASKLVLGTNFYSSRENESRQDFYKRNAIGFWTRGFSRIEGNWDGILNEGKFLDFDNLIKAAEKYIPAEVRENLSGNLQDLRDEGINSLVGGLVYGIRLEDVITFSGNLMDQQLIHLGLDPNKVKSDPFNYEDQVRVMGLLGIELYNHGLSEYFPGLQRKVIDQIVSSLFFQKSKDPVFISDFYRGRYVSDSGSPMSFDFLNISSAKGRLKELPIDAIPYNEGLLISTNPNSIKNFLQSVEFRNTLSIRIGEFLDLINSSDRYFYADRIELKVKTVGEKIREDLEAGMSDDEVRSKHGLEAKMSLAGHKATISRKRNAINGINSSSNSDGNGLYKPSPEEEEEISFFINEGMSDEEILSAYPINKMQLAARKARLTRQARAENPFRVSESKFRELILLRDGGKCQ